MTLKKLKIGEITLKNNLLLAPMVEVTDLAYRKICRKAGASIAYTEMLYTSQILHENKKTLNLMKKYKGEKPLGIQITGSKLEEFEKCIPFLKKYDLVDINCGCPSIRIVGTEAGSYLLNNPDKIATIIKLLKSHGLTVTAKIRLGFKENKVLEIAKKIEDAGADALTVHARLASHSNKTPADWKEIKKVREALKIPVIGNGDIISGKEAERMLKETGCDGIMIARAAIGDPLVFKRILHYFKTGKELEPNYKENIELLKEYIKLEEEYDIVDIPRIKYLGSSFLKGFDGASKLRQKLMSFKSFNEIKDFVNSLAFS